jgi:lipopolysaccharide transport system permease protein
MALYADLFRYRELFFSLFRRELRVKYRGSVLGVVWTLVNPLVLVGVYTLVFSTLWKAFSIAHYPLFIVTGLLVWVFFQASLLAASSSLLEHANLVKQVRFPRQLLPLAVVGTNLATFAVMLAVILPLNLVFVPQTRSTFWVALLLSLPLVGLTVLLPWFFLTPVFYTFGQLPGVQDHPRVVDLLHYVNFVTPVLIAIRDPLFFGRMPSGGDTAYAIAAALAALLLGAFVFRRIDDQLAAAL